VSDTKAAVGLDAVIDCIQGSGMQSKSIQLKLRMFTGD